MRRCLPAREGGDRVAHHPLDLEAVEWLAEMGVGAYKIASAIHQLAATARRGGQGVP